MNIAKMMKRTAAMGMALATVMSCAAISAGAADESTTSTVTAKVYVQGQYNPFRKGVTAYMTTPTTWNPLDLPIIPASDNATKTVSGTVTTISIPLTNGIFRFKSFPDGETSYKDGNMSVVLTDSDDDGYAENLTYTFKKSSFVSNQEYTINDCVTHANKAAIVGNNEGDHTLPITMTAE